VKPILALISAVAFSAGIAYAHHSFAAEYDAFKPVTLKGTLTKVDWINPHAWLFIDVKDDSGKVTNWAIEFGSPNALLRRGLRRTDFPHGIEVIVDGYRAKNGTATVNAKSVKLPDGRDLFAGSSGTGAPGAPPE
jgi:Family of unknown function (DUF6152)